MTGPVMPSSAEQMQQRSAFPFLELDTADVLSPSPVHNNDNRTALHALSQAHEMPAPGSDFDGAYYPSNFAPLYYEFPTRISRRHLYHREFDNLAAQGQCEFNR